MTMPYRDIVREIIDLICAAFDPEEVPSETSKLSDVGLDSLELVEAQLLLEDRWPAAEGSLDDIQLTTTIGDLARLVEPHA